MGMNFYDTSFQQLKNRKQELIQDLIKNKQHKKGCHCELCLWREEQRNKRPGRPYDFLTFLIPDLIHDLRVLHLVEKGIAKKTVWHGKKGWEYPFRAEQKVPIKEIEGRLIEILRDFPEFEEFPKGYYRNTYFKRLYHDLKCGRYRRTLPMLDQIDYQITKENLKKRKGRPKKHSLIRLKEIKEFIASHEKPVSRHEVLRKFNINAEELESYIWFLKLLMLKENPGRQKNQVVYFY